MMFCVHESMGPNRERTYQVTTVVPTGKTPGELFQIESIIQGKLPPEGSIPLYFGLGSLTSESGIVKHTVVSLQVRTQCCPPV